MPQFELPENKERHELLLFERRTLFALIAISFLTLLIYFFGGDTKDFLTNIVNPLPEHAPFDGTTYPIKHVPDWVNLNETERNASYDLIGSDKLIPLPTYSAPRLATSIDSLDWDNPDHNAIRNEKITYAVPYLGNYKLDGHEYVGSHPAVDIKVPLGTPVYAIANGVVTKVSENTAGFGYHVVIQHRGMPDPNGLNETVTLHSSYSHLSKILVKEREVVTRGQMIALSGDTGTATTPHIHFQIDNDEAPWHPYWPFTSAQAREAGLSFFEALNAGLGKDNALAYTIHPMTYIQKYLTAEASAVIKPEIPAETPIETSGSDAAVEQPIVTSEETIVVDTKLVASSAPLNRGQRIVLEIENQYFEVNKPLSMKLYYYNETDDLTNPPDGTVIFMQVIQNNGTFSPAVINTSSFNTGVASFIFTPLESTDFAIQVGGGPLFVVSQPITLKQETPVESTILQSLAFTDILQSNALYEPLKKLKDVAVIAGYPDGTFRPERDVLRVEALKMIFVALKARIKDSADILFPDVESGAWYLPYVNTGVEEKVVSGYPDGTFKPNATVNIVEFYKMLFLAAKTDIDPEIILSLPNGINVTDWFAPYIQEAVRRNILEIKDDQFQPGFSMTRGDIALALYKLYTLQEKGLERFE